MTFVMPKMVAMYRPWTAAEDAVMRERYAKDGPSALAARLNRSWNAVASRARALKVPCRKRRWSRQDDARLRDLWGDMSVYMIAKALGRPPIGVYWRAGVIGLQLGVPPGAEYISAAAIRTGYEVSSLRRILRWAGVKISLTMSDPRWRHARHHRHFVDPMDVDDAVSKWCAGETPGAAAKRMGMVPETVRRALVTSGVERPKKFRHWQVPSELIDRALAARNPELGSTAQCAAGVFPGTNARRDAAAMSISGRRTPSGIDRHRGGILRDTTVTLPKLPTKKHGRIKAEGVTRGRDPGRFRQETAL